MFKKKGDQEDRGFFGRNKLAMATATLMGTIIGAGILGIPYVVAKTGFVYGLIIMVVLGAAFLFLNLFMGEVVLRTKKQHQFPGYAEKYLGKWGKRITTISMLIGLYGALIAYLIGEGATLYALFGFGSPLLFTIIFFLITSTIIYLGMRATGKVELILVILLFLVVSLIGIFSFKNINWSYLAHFNLVNIFIPYGVIVFAYVGLPSIPELQEVLGNERKKMKKAIMIGSIVPIVLYVLFTLIIIGLVGLDNFELLKPNEKIATIALSIYSHQLLGIFANLLAMLSMFTSFLTIGIALKEIFEYDYGFSKNLSLFFTLSVPLVVALFNFTSFITVLGITGTIAGGLDGILIILMYWKAKLLGDRNPEYSMGKHYFIGTLLMIMFGLGIIYYFVF